MSSIMLPPFPSQDLAKLVLGYLAEEQLMTAYDEFLQASPYLDALGNEYDRIFMTSLRNILAEYRAVKIYVETCKPLILRKRLFQCTNLLDIVKFLISNIDIHKIQIQDNTIDKIGLDKQNVTKNSKMDEDCQVCIAQKLLHCVCNKRLIDINTTNKFSSGDFTPLQSSVETTSLSDLPGNHVTTRKKYDKVPDNVSSISQSNSGSEHEISSKQATCIYKNISDNSNPVHLNIKESNLAQDPNISIKTTDTLESRQKIDEFNDILKLVCNKNNSKIQAVNTNERISNAGTFQEFETGVSGGENSNINVPDSSTSDNINLQQVSTPNEPHSLNVISGDPKNFIKTTQTQFLLKVANVKDTVASQSNEIINVDQFNRSPYPHIKPKSEDNKIKIISDIKVDNETLSNSSMKMPAVLQNATSTPLLQMRTIVINGTSAYKSKTHLGTHMPTDRLNYTKDEIMAMPTIIITPVSGSSQNLVNIESQTTNPQKIPNTTPVSTICVQSLQPLTIDVSSNYAPTISTSTTTSVLNFPAVHMQKTCSTSTLVKTVDTTSASVPKDGVTATSTETGTPQGLPPARKSSSTPRRTSHVRVLDFTTPRRILHETISELEPSQNNVITEEVLTSSPNLTIINAKDVVNGKNTTNDTRVNEIKSSEDNNTKKIIVNNKSNWDADLRALLINDKNCYDTQTKRKSKSNKKKKTERDNTDEKKLTKKKTSKSKQDKKSSSPKTDTNVSSNTEKISGLPKPTINIVSAPDKGVLNYGSDKNQNKSNEEHDTPELERVSLQNVIGSRLNISDFLETPYKQALYDIQMETPRFLGPDLPDEPMSDIKIMNIPTPRFFNSSKGVDATPSSYSSRPTDYSSGGSYYKPDDQDYIPNPESLGYSGTSSKENISIDSPVKSEKVVKENTDKIKSSRPVRQCTKNVSYYNSNLNKTKDEKIKEDKSTEGTSSDLEIINSSSDKKSNKENTSKVLQDNLSVTKQKSVKKKRSSTKKLKSPKKEVVKSFMKIKPRRPTPTKVSLDGKNKKKGVVCSDTLTTKSQTRKRTSSKEKVSNIMPAVIIVPTKSRRKSSTPRKLHCTKSFNSESSGHNSPDLITAPKQNLEQNSKALGLLDSDTEHVVDGNTPPLRWSDDGSQDVKHKEKDTTANEIEDITKIQKYIETTVSCITGTDEGDGSLHSDLVKRGFDIETAKIIERDLLDTPPYSKPEGTLNLRSCIETEVTNEEKKNDNTIISDNNVLNNLQITQGEQVEYEDEIELSVCECNEESENYLMCSHDDTIDMTKIESTKLKDKFTMEVCIDDGVLIRLKATPFSMLLDLDQKIDPQNDEVTTSKYDSLYTPLKQSVKAQCYDIFDSTLTSLDTPLKATSPKQSNPEFTVTEIVLEIENVDDKNKSELKKRKRMQSGNTSDESVSENKKSKSDAQYLFNSANIQNIDIESVLSKLHGP
ncbi:uncharacterized protein LOC113515464 [Galleria mellonella]|uniref:Uncharacterized protein LOC113515464 n=1 Tax=Galleria mellonella TaxID=7137 RepID=A0A6J1WTC3_GALME|nr:uncharacterized protein LOC113515464 [Galleria mellonella]